MTSQIAANKFQVFGCRLTEFTHNVLLPAEFTLQLEFVPFSVYPLHLAITCLKLSKWQFTLANRCYAVFLFFSLTAGMLITCVEITSVGDGMEILRNWLRRAAETPDFLPESRPFSRAELRHELRILNRPNQNPVHTGNPVHTQNPVHTGESSCRTDATLLCNLFLLDGGRMGMCT